MPTKRILGIKWDKTKQNKKRKKGADEKDDARNRSGQIIRH